MTDVKTGETLFSEGKIEEAEKCFLDLLKKEPTNAEALNDLGVIQHAKGNAKGAEDLFLKAIASKQEYLDARLNLVDLYREAKRWSEAIAQLEVCIQMENKDPTLTLGTAELFDRALFNMIDDYEGYVAFRQDSLQDSIDDFDDQIKEMEARLDRKMETMINTFVAMEVALSKIKNQSEWLTGQINATYSGWWW